VAEDDEAERERERDQPDRQVKVQDNSLGRLLALSDGVFAIAMTLLAIDLKVPDGLGNPTSRTLLHALAQHEASYWAFLLSFYVIAIFWGAHRRLMRSATVPHPAVIRDTLFVLVLVAAMPFPTELLGQYGSTPAALAIYALANVLINVALLLLTYDVRRCDPAAAAAGRTEADRVALMAGWVNLAVFLIIIPGAYALGPKGPYLLLLLLISNRLVWLDRLAGRFGIDRLWRRPTRSQAPPQPPE
jgi:uncharacterized membrane protein